MCLLNLEHSTDPQLVANITVSDTQILCIAAIPYSEEEEEEEMNSLQSETSITASHGEESQPIACQVNEETIVSDVARDLLPSSDDTCSDMSSQVSVSRTPSSASEVLAEGKDLAQRFQEEEEERNQEESESPESLDKLLNGSPMDGDGAPRIPALTLHPAEGSMESSRFPFPGGKEGAELYLRPSRSAFPTPPQGFCRVRSNSAPPDPDRGGESSGLKLPEQDLTKVSRSPSPPLTHPIPPKSSLAVDPRMTKAWSPLTLWSSKLEGGGPLNEGYRCMWLGTEGGQIHIYTAGNNLRSRSKRQTLEMGSPVHCLR